MWVQIMGSKGKNNKSEKSRYPLSGGDRGSSLDYSLHSDALGVTCLCLITSHWTA